jgi:hypothetical protein
VALDEETGARLVLSITTLRVGIASNPEPLRVTEPPAVTIDGDSDEMTGPVASRKSAVDATVVPPVVTLIGPVDALEGTVTSSVVAVDALTVAVTPLNLTVLAPGVVENPVPVTTTAVPGTPADG